MLFTIHRKNLKIVDCAKNGDNKNDFLHNTYKSITLFTNTIKRLNKLSLPLELV